MGNFLSCWVQMILLTCVPPILFGLAVWGCRQLYFMLVGYGAGRPLLLAASLLSTPLREAGHVIACMISLHRIEDMRLINVHDPEGELGFVEHTYNPRNPIAVLGNFLYILAPVALGLLAVMLIFLTCFYGVLPAFFEEIGALGEARAGFGAYVGAAFSLIPAMFTTGSAHILFRIIGCLLLLALCLGIHIPLTELKDAISGFGVYAVIAAFASFVVVLFDDRVLRMVFSGLRAYATGVTALFVVVLLCAAVLVALGLLFGVLRTLFGWDQIEENEE